MKLISWNINGLRAVYKKGFASFLESAQPDILCLQEVKIQQAQVDAEVSLPEEYTPLFSFAEKKGYSGVATWLGADVPFQEKKTMHGLGRDAFDSEGRFLISYHKDFTLYNIYFPSGTTGEERQDFKYTFLDFLHAHISSLSQKERDKLIICGDYNICHTAIDIHHPAVAEKRELSGFLPEERAWMDSFAELGFTDSFRHVHGETPDAYTWWSYRAGARKKNLGWRIDYFFVANALAKKIKHAEILSDVEGSDHCPIVLELDL